MAGRKPKRNRRPLDFRSQWQPELVVVDVRNLGASGETLNVVLAQSVTVFTGIPPFRLSGAFGEKLPVSFIVSADGKQLSLTYTGLTPGAASVNLPAWSETMRTAQGGYVAPFDADVVIAA